MLVHGSGPSALSHVASAKGHASPGAITAEITSNASANQPASTEPGSPASANQLVAANNGLAAILSPIEDKDQAAAATQHARLLIQAQPRTAMRAQANSHSQSVQRLLQ